ncbi:DNA polymerase phi-domain-containing protein [Lactarius hengduanensis]|nr:DNA polymerase phi-domain-containing protein [Lactarius hengduanensis]
MSTILPLFWDLSSSDKKKRLDTSAKLVATLQKLQATFANESAEPDEPSGESFGVDGTPRDFSAEDVVEHNFRLDLLNSPDVAYSIRRLLRGLASPRQSSRLGFAVALTELLSRVSTVSCAQILALVLDASRTTGNQTGQEERDLLFARLFGLASIVHSGLLIRTHPPLPQSPSAPSTPESCEAVLKALRTLAHAKSWLAEPAYWAVGSALDLLAATRDADVPWREKVVRALLEEEFGETSPVEERAAKSEVVWTPEKIALALRAQRLWPEREHEWRWLWTPTFKRGNIFHQANLVTLARILRETGFEGEGDNAVVTVPGRAWRPQVHHIWDELLDQLLPLEGSGHTPKGSFPEFFRVVVDESLFSVSASNERKYWGFVIFKKALPRIKATDLPMLFTKNFMRTWINHLSHPDRYLHSFAKQIATDILSIVQKDPSLGFAFVLQLTGTHGNQQFDKLTRTKTVESILTTTNAEGIKDYIAHILGQVDGTSSSAKSDVQLINAHRSWIVDQIAALIRNGAIPKDDGWVQQILDWLTVHGIFVIKKRSPNSPIYAVHKVPSPPFTDDLRRQCRERLLSCLTDLTRLSNVTQTADGAQRVTGVTSDGEPWVSRVLQTIRRLEQASKHVELLSGFDSKDREILERACNLVTNLKKVSSDRSEDVLGVELLLQSSILQFYLEDNTNGRDVTSLESCIDGASRLFHSLDPSPVVSKPFQDDKRAIEPIDVLVDVIIGFLEKGTAYTRAAGNQSFSLLSGAVKDSTINLILSQLEHRDPSDLVVDSDEDSFVVEDDSSEAGHDNDSESPSADEHNETLGSNEAGNEGLEKTTEDFLKNLIDSAVDSSDEGSESEPGLDDDQMMAVDDQLAQLFKDRIRGKKSKEGAQREATHFKNRILDLLNILVKKQPKSAHIMQILIPLLTLAFSDEKQLSEKAIGLLRSRIDKLKVVPSTIDVDKTSDILNDLHVRARKVHSSDALAAISFCSLYVSKALLHVGADTTVRTAYTLSLVDFTERKASDLNTDFFSEFIKRHPRTAWDMRDVLLAAPAKAVNAYRRGRAYVLLQALLVCLPPMPEDELDNLAVFMRQLQRSVHSVLSSTYDADTTSTQSFKEALKLTLAGTRTTKRLMAERATSVQIWEPTIWGELCDRLKRSASLVELCRQIVKSMQAQQPSPKIDGGERVGRKGEKATAGRKRKVNNSMVTGATEKKDDPTSRKRRKKKVT